MPDHGPLKLVTGTSNPPLAAAIAHELDVELVPAVVDRFTDGEVEVYLKDEAEANVRDCDAFLIQSTNPPAANIIEMLLLIDALKRASAGRLTLVFPYFGYACQDRKDKPRTAISAKVMAHVFSSLLESPDRVCCFDLHATQIQAFFDIPRVDHIFLRQILVDDIRQRFGDEEVVIVAPDIGAGKAARAYARRVGEELAVLDKQRDPKTGKITIRGIIGAEYVRGKHAMIIDDMTRGSDTVVLGSEKLLEVGASAVSAYAAHGLLAGKACEALLASAVTNICVTDTIFISEEKREKLAKKLTVIPAAPFIARAIDRIHTGKGVSQLFDEPTVS